MILSNLLWIPKKEISNIGGLKTRCTVNSKYDKEPIKNYIETEDLLGIPRNFQSIPNGTKDERILPKANNFEFVGDLRPIQQNIIDDWHRYRTANIDDWIIKADTGVGKTIIMLKIACELKVPFLVIVPLERLMTYWIDQIKKFTTLTDDDIGVVQQDRCEYEGKTACIGIVHSLCKDKYQESFKDHFGLIIIDELHATAAKEFSKVLALFKAKHRCGASATLDRQDGMQDVYFHHLGRNILSSEKKTQPKPDVYYYEYKETSGKFPVWIDQYDVIKRRAFLLSMLSNNSDRNGLITYFADILINKGMQTLIIGDRISQLEEIQKFLIEKGHNNTGLYIGKTPDNEKKRIEKESSCIIATKKMLEIGIDIDTLRGIIFATPSSNVIQMVGRVRRINPSMPDPVVIDIIDTYYAETKRWQASRSKWYQKEGFNTKYIAR